MHEIGILSQACNSFVESRYNHYGHGDPKKRDVYRRCFINGFSEGVKFYANHLYNKGSIFDIVRSIRHTADYDDWSPLLDFEKTILKVLDKYKKGFENSFDIRQELKQAVDLAKKEIAKRDQIIENQKKEIEDLNNWLTFLKK